MPLEQKDAASVRSHLNALDARIAGPRHARKLVVAPSSPTAAASCCTRLGFMPMKPRLQMG